jgi:hypothetical protein
VNTKNTGKLIDNYAVIPEYRLKEGREIFEKAAREQGLKVYVQKDK